MPDFTEFAVSPKLSVMVTLAARVFPASAPGIRNAKELEVRELDTRELKRCAFVTVLTPIQLYVYGDVPPVNEVEKETLVPVSKLCDEEGEIEGAAIPWLMVIVEVCKEFTVIGTCAESVTITFAYIVFPASAAGTCHANVFEVREFDTSMFAISAFVTELNTMKLYVYGEVPPDSDAEKNSYWPVSTTGVFDADNKGTEGAGFIVIVPDFTEFAVTGFIELSVTNTLAVSVFPASALGINHANVFEVSEFEGKSALNRSALVIELTPIQLYVNGETPLNVVVENEIMVPVSHVCGDDGEMLGVPITGVKGAEM